MFENIGNFFKRMVKNDQKEIGSKDSAKERLHLVLMQDRANVSADFLELMKQEIIDVIKKYIIVDESAIDVRLTNKANDDGTTGAPALYANIPIVNIKNDMKAEKIKEVDEVKYNKDKEISDSKIINSKNEIKADEKKNEEIKNEIDINIKNNNIEENKNKEETNETKKEEINNITKNIEKNENIIINEKNLEETSYDESYEDEDDDDVTFDDLLKAAEEDDKKKKNKQEKKK